MKRCLIVLLLAAAAMAQGPPQTQVVRPGPDGMPLQWWKQPQVIDRLNLTPEQRKKIDDVFQQSRVKLIDTTAAVDREEAIMEQLMTAAPPDAAKVRPQIDRVAQARAELEKVNATMLLGMRLLLTKDQWDNLRDATRPGRGPLPRRVR
jgi:Spy/CpxP family protein refolding chaperone